MYILTHVQDSKITFQTARCDNQLDKLVEQFNDFLLVCGELDKGITIDDISPTKTAHTVIASSYTDGLELHLYLQWVYLPVEL